MNGVVLSRIYAAPPVCEKDILRYAGCKGADAEIKALLQSCLDEIQGRLTYRVCFCSFPLEIRGDVCDFQTFSLSSQKLAVNLKGCERAVLFAATVGVEIDRLIARYGHLSPSRALMFQAIGAERIEALCDAFCADVAREYHTNTKPRFSPGYGDLPLSAQKNLFAVLSPEKQIGLTLNDSLLMSPSKSVTAMVGLTQEKQQRIPPKCALCDQRDCLFRGVL